MHLPAPGLHHRLPVRLLVVGGPNHEDLALETEQGAGKRESRAPLTGAGLGRQLLDPRLGVVERLGHRGVGLVGTGRAHTLVLVVDACRTADQLLQVVCPIEGARSPQPVDLPHLLGDLHEALTTHLLEDQVHREQGCKIVRPHRLMGPGMEDRGRGHGKVGHDVVPMRRKLGLGQDDLGNHGGKGTHCLVGVGWGRTTLHLERR